MGRLVLELQLAVVVLVAVLDERDAAHGRAGLVAGELDAGADPSLRMEAGRLQPPIRQLRPLPREGGSHVRGGVLAIARGQRAQPSVLERVRL
jgi:hypothetical protein